MLIYATPEQLAASVWAIDPAPANVAARLRLASGLVRDATFTAFYTTDTEGLPSDATVLAAFTDATMAQVASWSAMGIDPMRGAAQARGPVSAKSIASASFTYAGADQAAAVQSGAAETLCAESVRILREARLFSYPIVRG